MCVSRAIWNGSWATETDRRGPWAWGNRLVRLGGDLQESCRSRRAGVVRIKFLAADFRRGAEPAGDYRRAAPEDDNIARIARVFILRVVLAYNRARTTARNIFAACLASAACPPRRRARTRRGWTRTEL